MPELPEVESIRLSLAPKLLGRTVTAAVLHRRDVLVAPGDPFGGFARQRGGKRKAKPARVQKAALLEGTIVSSVERRGKQLAIVGESEELGRVVAVGVQLGMSGQLFHRAAGQRVPQASHIHAEWRLDDGSRVVFRDPRRFGGLRIFSSADDLAVHWAILGPDALTIDARALAEGLAGSDRAIKAALLDQGVIAGVGNIYADEALFMSGIAPARLAASLKPAQVNRLAGAIRTVLAAAINAGGSTLTDYVDANGNPGSYQAMHRVYGRGGQPCVTCRRPLHVRQLAQRTTVWCPHCQG